MSFFAGLKQQGHTPPTSSMLDNNQSKTEFLRRILLYFFQMDVSVETASFRSRRSSAGSTYSTYSNYSRYSGRSSRSGAGRLRRWTSTASLKHQDKQPGKLLALRIASLAVGCAACGMAYSLDSFTAYSGDLKTLFRTTQSQGIAISQGIF